MAAIKEKAKEVLPNLAADDPEAGRLMTSLVPDLAVCPYKICDGGSIVWRAKATLFLAAFASDSAREMRSQILERPLTIDLFDPPQRVKFREEILSRRTRGFTTRKIAKELGLTLPTVQRSLALSKVMEAEGLTDPYILLTVATTACGLRRHLHPRYRFEPVPPPSPGPNS